MTDRVEQELPKLEDWLIGMLSTPDKQPKPKPLAIAGPPKAKARPGKAWIPPSHYIPDNPNPQANYTRQAANIARSMREAIDSNL